MEHLASQKDGCVENWGLCFRHQACVQVLGANGDSIFPAVGAAVKSLSSPCRHSPRSCSLFGPGQAECGVGIRAESLAHMWGARRGKWGRHADVKSKRRCLGWCRFYKPHPLKEACRIQGCLAWGGGGGTDIGGAKPNPAFVPVWSHHGTGVGAGVNCVFKEHILCQKMEKRGLFLCSVDVTNCQNQVNSWNSGPVNGASFLSLDIR